MSATARVGSEDSRTGLASHRKLFPSSGSHLGPGEVPPEKVGVCTADDPRAQREVETLLTDPDLASFRRRAGLTDASVSDLEVLTDPKDSSICGRLQRLVPGEYWTRGGK